MTNALSMVVVSIKAVRPRSGKLIIEGRSQKENRTHEEAPVLSETRRRSLTLYTRRPYKKQLSPTSLASVCAGGPRVCEVSFFKKSEDVLGVHLAPKGDSCGAVVAKINRDSIAAKSKRLLAGDTIMAVNGVAVTDHKHAMGLIRSAEGTVQCVVSTASALPEGWTEHTDRNGEVYFSNKELRRKSQIYPTAIDADIRREATINKPSKGAEIGISLVKPHILSRYSEEEGDSEVVLITHVARNGLAAERIVPGDMLRVVDGVNVADFKHAAEMLRAAEGGVHLVISSASALPEGWTEHTDKGGERYYIHEELRLKSFCHPAGVDIEAHTAPNTPCKVPRCSEVVASCSTWRTISL